MPPPVAGSFDTLFDQLGTIVAESELVDQGTMVSTTFNGTQHDH